ncbi:MAG: SAM-dependent methyltransferase [Candidatus Dactylopiibacterium carminicum]|uniref:SAM-dependent methyltransferase n=2 Tax=Candidatus Dactylopiibacterium carminicum TaxID=857335 RepID=A0A272ERT7_9RHOO|nr:class I SAM-dependent methyltransferase [Candidatus Dactylopiibacterium carminicum]PAS92817.1 MAG: SAM-dependent methyltransferase [Candidatus Dactylopiibacterium carminicum]PAS96268.1 MAG: SAM-dependent methyltransferase [Candidatus Dactylopiibacterium carminicum]
MSLRKSATVAVCCALTLGIGTTWAQTGASNSSAYEPMVGQAGKDVIWVPTSQALVDRMLDMAKLTPKDNLVDLGSGDGRLVITAAKRGATARGIEYNPDMVALSRQAAAMEGVTGRATFEQADIFASDFSAATVVTLFLLPELNLRLRPTLLDMKPGTRVVSNSFNMDDWKPDEEAVVTEGCTTYCSAFKWIVPAKVAGTWKLGDKELVLTQTFQMIEGVLRSGGAVQSISDARLDGAQIRFSVSKEHYTGMVNGKEIQGRINGKVTWRATLVEG